MNEMNNEQEQTPCEKLGYKVGDRFVVLNGDTFEESSIVELFKVDGSSCPLFKLIEGKCLHRICNGEPGAYLNLQNVRKIAITDAVDSPSHYNAGEVECIVAIKASMTPAEFQGYLKGNAMKYLWRMGLKGKPLVDVQKAQWYVNKLASTLQEQSQDI